MAHFLLCSRELKFALSSHNFNILREHRLEIVGWKKIKTRISRLSFAWHTVSELWWWWQLISATLYIMSQNFHFNSLQLRCHNAKWHTPTSLVFFCRSSLIANNSSAYIRCWVPSTFPLTSLLARTTGTLYFAPDGMFLSVNRSSLYDQC